jgi:glucosylceramidase
MTIQNEPAATQTWESCLYSPEEEAEMALLLKKRLPDTKIYIWDHNRDIMLDRINGSLSVPNAKEAVYGVAYHWYDGDKNAEIAKVKEAYPDLHILFTEGCVELLNLNKDDPSSAIGTFENGRRYAENYIRDLNYGSEGFLDWNLLLDMNGGPNRVGNYCEAPILTDGESLHPTYSYYFIKHLSSFLRPGAKVMEVEAPEGVLAVAGKNQEGSLALVLLNLKEGRNLSLSIGAWKGKIPLGKNEIVSIELEGVDLW